MEIKNRLSTQVSENEFGEFMIWYKKLMNYRKVKTKDRVGIYYVYDKVDNSKVACKNNKPCSKKDDDGNWGKPIYTIYNEWYKLWNDCESK